jgi:hypothetical protein
MNPDENLEQLEEEVDQGFLLVTFDDNGEPAAEAHNISGIEVLGTAKWLENWAFQLLKEEGY